jgi:hypothetical protein
MHPRTLIKPAAIPLLGLALALTIVGQAAARDLSRSGSYVTGRGHSGSYSSHVSGNRRDGLTRNQSVTTQSGRTLNRSSTTTYDRASRRFDRSVTGVNGNTRVLTGTAGGGAFSGSYTTGSGGRGSFAGTTTRNEDGSRSRNGSVTTDDGRTYQRSVATSHDAATRTLERSITGPGGHTRSGAVTLTPNP